MITLTRRRRWKCTMLALAGNKIKIKKMMRTKKQIARRRRLCTMPTLAGNNSSRLRSKAAWSELKTLGGKWGERTSRRCGW